MSKFLKSILINEQYLIITYIIIIFVVIFFISKFYRKAHGNFGEGNIYSSLRKLYEKCDYPFVKQIILPMSKDSFAYYDAIVLGDHYIYIIEVKNHNGSIIIDPIDDWIFEDSSDHKITISNPFYENDIKKNVLSRHINIKADRIIEIVVLNKKCIAIGKKGINVLIKNNKLNKLIEQYENTSELKKISPRVIEKKGNYILELNLKNRLKRRKLISTIKNQRAKR